jgi:hypothetical protein
MHSIIAASNARHGIRIRLLVGPPTITPNHLLCSTTLSAQ